MDTAKIPPREPFYKLSRRTLLKWKEWYEKENLTHTDSYRRLREFLHAVQA